MLAAFERYEKVPKTLIWTECRDPLEAEARALLGLTPGVQSQRPRGYFSLRG